ncbi:hypothetical protein [Flavobacterium tegetincola]|uniref:hypothetical protein n=1 Tax=Flavobacterium tegetincola TaxID=150172 RepID=UPI0003FA0932|nr:hypothetical protein [Flavobacterium tegetincola]
MIVAFLCLDFTAFAQGSSPGTGNGTGDLEGDDVAVPINGKLIWLAICGIVFAYYTYIKRSEINVTP